MLSPVSLATWPIFTAWLTSFLAPIITLHSGVDSRVKHFWALARRAPAVCVLLHAFTDLRASGRGGIRGKVQNVSRTARTTCRASWGWRSGVPYEAVTPGMEDVSVLNDEECRGAGELAFGKASIEYPVRGYRCVSGAVGRSRRDGLCLRPFPGDHPERVWEYGGLAPVRSAYCPDAKEPERAWLGLFSLPRLPQ